MTSYDQWNLKTLVCAYFTWVGLSACVLVRGGVKHWTGMSRGSMKMAV